MFVHGGCRSRDGICDQTMCLSRVHNVGVPDAAMIWVNDQQSRSMYFSCAEKEEDGYEEIAYVLIALSVLAGVATAVTAFDAKTFYEQMERQSGG